MDSFRMRFIIGKISDEELLTLKQGEPIISKMLLTPQDYSVFHYKEGDEIEAETVDGNRIWSIIQHMEVVEDGERVIMIFTLIHKPGLDAGT